MLLSSLLKANLIHSTGRNYPKLPCKLPEGHNYCVLDWFKVTRIWAEINAAGHKQLKYRFEKLQSGLKSWWMPAESKTWADPTIRAARQCCNICSKSWPQIYEQGWFCLDHKCPAWWKLRGETPPVHLTYNPAYLAERKPWKSTNPPMSLQPSEEVERTRPDNTSYAAWKGTHCPDCGRCSLRTKWLRRECANCQWGVDAKPTVLRMSDLLDIDNPIATGHAIPQNVCLPPLTEDYHFTTNYRVHTYTTPGGEVVSHFMSNKHINEQPGGPNEMFEDLQRDSTLNLQRLELDVSQGEL
jgi:hypothetical protein